jgi:hypothetical protein
MPGGWSTHAHLGRIVKEIATNIQRTGVLVDDGKDLNGNASTNQYHMYSNTNNNTNSNNNNNNNSHNNSNTNNGQQGNFDTIKVVFDEYSRKPPPPIPGARSKSLGLTNNSSSSSVVTFTNTNGSQYGSNNGGSSNNIYINNNNNNHNNNNKMNAKTTSTTGDMSSSSSSSHTQSRPALTNSYSSTLAPEARIIMELTPEKVEELLESQIAFDHFVDHLDIVMNSRTLKREWWLGNDNVSRKSFFCLSFNFCQRWHTPMDRSSERRKRRQPKYERF